MCGKIQVMCLISLNTQCTKKTMHNGWEDMERHLNFGVHVKLEGIGVPDP